MNIGSGSDKGSRRKNLDAELNLVPFIDLLSMCICFLLMTAVWIEVGAVQVKQSRGTEAPATKANQLDLTVKFTAPSVIEFTLKKQGKLINRELLKAESIPLLLEKLDQSLSKVDVKNVASGLVTPKTGVSYGDLVSVMDMLRKHQIINLGVVPTGAI